MGAALVLLATMAPGVSGGADRVGLVLPRYVVAGGAPAVVVAQVLDAAGEPVPDGTPVAFVASLGLRFDPAKAATVDGMAVTRLVPGTEAGFARIDATAEGARTDVVLWVRPGPAAHVLWLRSEPPSLTAGGQATVVVRLTDAFGNMAEGDVVRWQAGGGTVAPPEGRVVHGEARAVFTAAPVPGRGWVLVESDGPVGRVAIPVGGPVDRTALAERTYLPRVGRQAGRVPGCRDVLVNGSFEIDADGDRLPDGWVFEPADASVVWLVGDALDGEHAVRLDAGGGSSLPTMQQVLGVKPGVKSAVLRLWVRGGGPDLELRVAVWTMMEVGPGLSRVPVLLRRVPVFDPGWTLLAFGLQAPLAGETTLELAPRLDGSGGTSLELDAVRLDVCE